MTTHMKGINEYFNMGGKITSHLGFALATVGFATDKYIENEIPNNCNWPETEIFKIAPS